MSQYQESIVILKNASEFALKSEASLEEPKAPGNILQEIKTIDENLIKLQQEYSSFINPLKSKEINLKKKEEIEKIIFNTEKEIEKKISSEEYKTAQESKPVLEKEIFQARQEYINESKNYEKIRYDIKDKYAGDREARKSELKKIEDEYEPKLNNIRNAISEKEQNLHKINNILESIEFLNKLLNTKKTELENIEYNLLAAEEAESEDGKKKKTDLEQKIETAQKTKAYLQTELQLARSAPEATFIPDTVKPDAADKSSDVLSLLDQLYEPSPLDYVSGVTSGAIIQKQIELEKVMQEIEAVLESRANTSNIPIKAAISNIDLYERKLAKINKQIALSSLDDTLEKQRNECSIRLNEEHNKLDVLLSKVPDLQKLLNRKRKINSDLRIAGKAESSEIYLRNKIATEKDPKNILDSFREYYKSNESFYNYLIAELVFNFIVDDIFSGSIEENIKQFTYNPGDEEIDTEYPNRVLTPQELKISSDRTVKINDDLVFSFVDKICRQNKELHDIVVEELNIQLQEDIKKQNRMLQKVNPEDVFAEIFFNYPKRGYSKNKNPIIPIREIRSSIKIIVKMVVTKFINFIKDFIGDNSYKIQKLEELLKKEYSYLDPESAQIERNKILQQAEKQKEEIIKQVQEDNTVPEDMKPIEIRKLLKDIDNETNRRLLFYKDKDPAKVITLKQELDVALKEREILSQQKIKQDIETQAPKIPSSSDLIAAVSESFEYLINNPGINSVEDNKYFIKLLSASKDIFNTVRNDPEIDMYWVKSLIWNRQKTEFFNLQQLSVIFTLQIDSNDSKKGVFKVTLSVAQDKKNYSFGEISIILTADDKGKINAEITNIISPTIRDQEGNIIKNQTNTIKNTRAMVLLEKNINIFYREMSNINKRDFMLIPANKELVVNKTAEDFIDFLIEINALKPEEEKTAMPNCKEKFSKLYDSLLPPNKKEARRKKLLEIIKIASNRASEIS